MILSSLRRNASRDATISVAGAYFPPGTPARMTRTPSQEDDQVPGAGTQTAAGRPRGRGSCRAAAATWPGPRLNNYSVIDARGSTEDRHTSPPRFHLLHLRERFAGPVPVTPRGQGTRGSALRSAALTPGSSLMYHPLPCVAAFWPSSVAARLGPAPCGPPRPLPAQ